MKYFISLFLTFVIAHDIFAQSSHPKIEPNALPPRIHGLDQLRGSSCMADSEVQALEQVFANKGHKVLLSSWHRHYKKWEGKDLNRAKIRPLTTADRRLLEQTGSFIPDYMHPSSDAGLGQAHGIRPNISSISQIDTTFPKDDITGFTYELFSFSTKDNGVEWSNSRRHISYMIEALQEGKAVTLDIHAVLLERFFDDATGLFYDNQVYSHDALNLAIETDLESASLEMEDKSRYVKDARSMVESDFQLESDENVYSTEINHRVAVVGYYPTFYAAQYPKNPGAFIIRNSWNSSRNLAAVRSAQNNPKLKASLEKFRFPLYRAMNPRATTAQNLSGYYVIPAQYIQDMIDFRWPGSAKRGVGGFQVLNMNFDSFARHYQNYAVNYETLKIPFTCGQSRIRSAINQVSNILNFIDSDPSYAMQLLSQESSFGPSRRFQLAYLPVRNGNHTVVDNFLAGRFDDFYCRPIFEIESFSNSWPGRPLRSNHDVWQSVQVLSRQPNSFMSWMQFFEKIDAAGMRNWN